MVDIPENQIKPNQLSDLNIEWIVFGVTEIKSDLWNIKSCIF